MTREFDGAGVIPACLMPFSRDLSIDEAAYRRHVADLASVDGISAITVNGHAAEVHALSSDEQRQGVELAREAVGDALPLVAGIATSDCREAARLARQAEAAGADALLVFPSEVLALGGNLSPETARAHVRAIADATPLPLILFQYPLTTGRGYPLDLLCRLCESVPTIVAIKDWCNDPVLHERHVRALHTLARPIRVLTTHSAWLLSSLVLGCDGILSGAGSVIASLHVQLWRAIRHDDLAEARRVYERIYPTVRAFYGDPLLNMHNRMKEALVLLGRLDEAHVRPPLVKLDRAEVARIARLLEDAGLQPGEAHAEPGPRPSKGSPT